MRNFTKLTTCVLALAIVCLSFAGCSLVKDMDDVNAYKEQQENIKKAEAQMAETVMTLNGEIDIVGGFYGWYFSNEYKSHYEQAAAALKASSSADSSATPQVDTELVKANVEKTIAQVKLAYKKACDAGIKLSRKDKDFIRQQIDSLKAQVAQQGNSFKDKLYIMNTNEDYLQKIIEEEYLGNMYYASLMSDSFATTKHILVKYSDSVRTKEEALAMAKEIKSELDGGQDFDKLMNEKSEDARNADGSLVNKEGQTFSILSGKTTVYTDAALALSEGEISGVVADDKSKGCYIIKKCPLNLSDVSYSLYSGEYSAIETILIDNEKKALAESATFEATDKLNYYTEIYNAN